MPCRFFFSDTISNNLESFPLPLVLVGTDPLAIGIRRRQGNVIAFEAVGTSNNHSLTASLPVRHHKLVWMVGPLRVESEFLNTLLEQRPIISY